MARGRDVLSLSERSGWRHLYPYRADGEIARQLTDGEWELRTRQGVDGEAGWVYFSGTRRCPLAATFTASGSTART